MLSLIQKLPPYCIYILIILLASCSGNQQPTDRDKKGEPVVQGTPFISYTVIDTLPHDTNSFTEGLLFHEGQLYESTGSPDGLPETKSHFGPVDSKTGVILAKVTLDRNIYFGEGISFFGNKVYQLTYKNKIGMIYDATSFKKLAEFPLPGEEGWALTTDAHSLIMSDGSHNLFYLDPVTLNTVKTLAVSENGYERDSLNELELINGSIFANIWTSNFIVRIDTATGKITGKLDLTHIAETIRMQHPRTDVLNGIAYDPETKRVFITGKLWPAIYVLELQE